MRSRRKKFTVAVLVSVTIVVGTLWVISIRQAALRALVYERSRDSELIPFKRIELKPYAGDDVKLIQSAREVRGLTVFRGAYFAATDGGLVKLSINDKLVHR